MSKYLLTIALGLVFVQSLIFSPQLSANNEPLSKVNVLTDVKTVRGKIMSPEKEWLSGVKVAVKGTTYVTYSNVDGNFSIEASETDVLVFSLLGFKTQEILVGTNQNMSIVLEEKEALGAKVVYGIGSRDQTRTDNNKSVGIDIIAIKDVAAQTGYVELNQILQYLSPSFNANRQTGADLADHVDPSSLRGLGPDQTLYLVNGKRYHPSAIINVFGARGRGNAGTDLNSIPVSAVDHIEILRDGAAAQYGSDAVAGVINVVLKAPEKGTTGSIGYGTNVTGYGSTLNYGNQGKVFSNRTDGATWNANLSHGFNIGKAMFNVTADYMNKAHTFRPNNETIFPDENYRLTAGNPALSNAGLYLNSKLPVGNAGEIYLFGGYSYRNTDANMWTIPFDDVRRNVYEIYSSAYTPNLISNISNLTTSFGYRTKIGTWNFDASNTIGRNYVSLTMNNTLNPSLLRNSPTKFNNGAYGLLQNSVNVDINRKFAGVLSGLNLAFGAEHRYENYQIVSGDEAAWKTYPTPPITVTNPDGSTSTVFKAGSSQGFPGSRPDQALSESRSVIGAYGDAELGITRDFLLTGALRFENYSDFGSAFGGKLGAVLHLGSRFLLRGSVQTGFRAPSLSQVHFRSTINDVDAEGNNFEKVVFNNSSDLTKRVGIPSLKAETSLNLVAGFLYQPNERLSFSVDAYQIQVQDRIILTGAFFDNDDILGVDLQRLEVKAAQFFTNALDTKTQGLDLATNYRIPLNDGALSFNLAANFNQMTLTSVKTASGLETKRDKYISERELQFLLNAAPSSKGRFGITYSKKKWQLSLNNTYFSQVDLIGTNGILGFNPALDQLLTAGKKAEWLAIVTDSYKQRITTDLVVGYNLSKSLNLSVGGNNIFDVYPTIQNPGATDGNSHWDGVQMGIGGAYFFGRLALKL